MALCLHVRPYKPAADAGHWHVVARMSAITSNQPRGR
jgi:hypothetical protein